MREKSNATLTRCSYAARAPRANAWFCAAVAMVLPLFTFAQVQRMEVVSTGVPGMLGGQADGFSESVLCCVRAFSSDNRFAVFTSYAGNLVDGDRNGQVDIYLRDRVERRTYRVGLGLNGAEPNGRSGSPAISGNGRYVVFDSVASNLVEDDDNGMSDVFLHDRDSGVTTRISQAADGSSGNGHSLADGISGDGLLVSFSSYASNLVPADHNETSDVFLYSVVDGTTTRISVSAEGSEGNAYSAAGTLDDAGSRIVFVSNATNLVPDDTNMMRDVFVRDLGNGTVSRVSVNSAGEQLIGSSTDATISGDGEVVAFISAYDIALPHPDQIYTHDLRTGVTARESEPQFSSTMTGPSQQPSLSADGRYVGFSSLSNGLVANDTNQNFDTFVRDRLTGAIVRVSVSSSGAQAPRGSSRAAVSPDGRFVMFHSDSRELIEGDVNRARDVFVHDRVAATTELLSVADSIEPGADGGSGTSSLRCCQRGLSEDGRFVVFGTVAPNLVAGLTGWSSILLHDRQSGESQRIDVSESGEPANGDSYNAAITPDGTLAAFDSFATNLLAVGASNLHVYLKHRNTGSIELISQSSLGVPGDHYNQVSSISEDGARVSFSSYSSNLVETPLPFGTRVYVRDRIAQTTRLVSRSSSGQPASSASIAQSISGDGRFVAFTSYDGDLVENDTNGLGDLFVHEIDSGTTTRESVTSGGAEANGDTGFFSISGDGRLVAFESTAANLVELDRNDAIDIFVRDRTLGRTWRVSVDSRGIEANGASREPSISDDGRFVAFVSDASNLVDGDHNNVADAFIHDLTTRETRMISLDAAGNQGNGASHAPSVAPDAGVAVFSSDAGGWTPDTGANGGHRDVFAVELAPGTRIHGDGFEGPD